MKVLVTGGAGYIGSHAVVALRDAGHDVLIYDNFSTGHHFLLKAPFVEGDISDAVKLDNLFNHERIDAVMHFAAHSLVGESAANPAKYYRNNVGHGLVLLERMVENGVKKIVFSSTAAVYGEPRTIPIAEQAEKNPTNTYGETKLTFEQILARFDQAYGLKYVSLRYFNAAGAHPMEHIGEAHNPETHLIPLVLQVVAGERECIQIYGNDYPTPDGTCIRDYIHVCDLADAHVLAIEALGQEQGSAVFNLGNGNGYSVKEIIQAAIKVTGREIPIRIGPRREGDPAILVASSQKIQARLRWRPVYTNIEEIIRTAWVWKRM